MQSQYTGDIPDIVLNEAGVYPGNLVYYFQILDTESTNWNNPYHNGRHILHIFWLCYQACLFYRDELTRREKRKLLIAALFHDIRHRGVPGDDVLNLELAIEALRNRILEEDRRDADEIAQLMLSATQYPYVVRGTSLSLSGKILRDADASQAMDRAWYQQVVHGLAAEQKKSHLEVLRMQEPFLRNLRFLTVWAQKRFPAEEIEAKIEEAGKYIRILEMDPVAMQLVTT